MNNELIAKHVLKVAKNLIASDESWEKVKTPLLKELKKNFKGITEKNNNFFFDYKDCKCYIGYTDGFKSYYFMTGHDSKKRIDVPFLSDPDSQTLIQKFKNIVDKRLAAEQGSGVNEEKSIETELKKNFNKIQRRPLSFVSYYFEYKGYDCTLSYRDSFYVVSGMDYDRKKIVPKEIKEKNYKKAIQLFKKMIDEEAKDYQENDFENLKKSVSKHFKNWNIDKISKTSQGLKVEISKKAYGDGYDVFCQVKNGRVYDSDSRGLIVDEAEKVAKETGIKDFIIVGYAD